MAVQVTPWTEKAVTFRPPDRTTLDISPNGMMARVSRTIPTVRWSVVTTRVSKVSAEAMSRMPLSRSPRERVAILRRRFEPETPQYPCR